MDSQQFLQRLQTGCPRLACGARLHIDKVSGKPVLLYPEGVILLNASGQAILQHCDGTRLLAEVVARLAESYDLSSGELEQEVSHYLFQLYQQNIVELVALAEASEG